MRSPDSWVAPALAVAAVVLIGGASAAAMLAAPPEDASGGNATAIEQQVRNRTASLDSYEATVVRTVEFGNETRTRRARMAYEDGWLNVTWGGPDVERPVSVVSNDTTSWEYDRTTGHVKRVFQTNPRDPNLLAHVSHRLLKDVNLSYGGTTSVGEATTVRVSYQEYGENVSLALGRWNAERAARLRAASGGEINVTTTVWIDTEHHVPVRVRRTATNGNRTLTIQRRIENLSVGVDVPDRRFAIPEPAADDTEVSTTRLTRYRLRAAFRNDEHIPLPDPSLPRGFHFSEAVVRHHPTESVSFVYTNDVSTIRLTRVPGTDTLIPFANPVQISPGRQRLAYARRSNRGVVAWRCWAANATYRAEARLDRLLDRETLVQFADSVGCPEATGGSGNDGGVIYDGIGGPAAD